jgi:Fe2+ transport system protein FeoA
VFSLDVKDPQNTQLLQRLSSMGIKENKWNYMS